MIPVKNRTCCFVKSLLPKCSKTPGIPRLMSGNGTWACPRPTMPNQRQTDTVLITGLPHGTMPNRAINPRISYAMANQWGRLKARVRSSLMKPSMAGKRQSVFFNVWFHEPHAPIAHLNRSSENMTSKIRLRSTPAQSQHRPSCPAVTQVEELGVTDNTLIGSDNGSYRRIGLGLRGRKGMNWEGGSGAGNLRMARWIRVICFSDPCRARGCVTSPWPAGLQNPEPPRRCDHSNPERKSSDWQRQQPFALSEIEAHCCNARW